MSSSLPLQRCLASLVNLIWIFFVMGGRWPYNCCFVGCYLQDLFNIARNILVWLPSSLFSSLLVRVHVAHPYCSIDTIVAWKKTAFHLICHVWLPYDRFKVWSIFTKYQNFFNCSIWPIDGTLTGMTRVGK